MAFLYTLFSVQLHVNTHINTQHGFAGLCLSPRTHARSKSYCLIFLHFTCSLLLCCTSGLHSKKLPHVTLTVTQKKEGPFLHPAGHSKFLDMLKQKKTDKLGKYRQLYFAYVINPCTDNMYTFNRH